MNLRIHTSRVKRFSAVLSAPLLAMALSFGVGTGAAHADTDTQAVRQAVVHLVADWQGDFVVTVGDTVLQRTEHTSMLCTGFFVDDKGSIATAGHCLDPDQVRDALYNELEADLRDEAKQLNIDPDALIQEIVNYGSVNLTSTKAAAIYGFQPSELHGPLNNDGVQLQVVAFTGGDAGDNGLLRLNNYNGKTPYLVVAQERPAEQSTVTAVGFPGDITNNADAMRQNASFKTGKVSSYQIFGGAAYTEVDAGMEHGMSGGPVLNDKGQVIGVVSMGFDGTSLNFATDTTTFRAFLSGNGVVLVAPASPVLGSNLFVYVGGGCALVALVIAAYYVIVVRRKKAATTIQPQA